MRIHDYYNFPDSEIQWESSLLRGMFFIRNLKDRPNSGHVTFLSKETEGGRREGDRKGNKMCYIQRQIQTRNVNIAYYSNAHKKKKEKL